MTTAERLEQEEARTRTMEAETAGHGRALDTLGLRLTELSTRGENIAEVLDLTVDEAAAFFAEDEAVLRSLDVLRSVGLGYLRLGQPATELSGGEAQRIKRSGPSRRRPEDFVRLDLPEAL